MARRGLREDCFCQGVSQARVFFAHLFQRFRCAAVFLEGFENIRWTTFWVSALAFFELKSPYFVWITAHLALSLQCLYAQPTLFER